MYIVSFHLIFNENANILAKRMNIPYVVDFIPKKDDLIIIFGAHEQANTLYALQEQIKFKCILIQSEQYESKIFDNKFYIELLKNNYLLDWSRYNIERFKKQMDIKVYSFYFYDFFMFEHKNRPIDFFFCGAHSPEREFRLNQFKLQNPGFTYEFDFSNNHLSFNELNNKLAKVKYVINLPYYKNNSLETHRINKALASGCQVISIYSSDLYLNEKYKDYVHFVNDLSDFCPLLELFPKKDYNDFMKTYAESQILHNVNALQYIKTLHDESIKTNESLKTEPEFINLNDLNVKSTKTQGQTQHQNGSHESKENPDNYIVIPS